jgi:hypothetical protein
MIQILGFMKLIFMQQQIIKIKIIISKKEIKIGVMIGQMVFIIMIILPVNNKIILLFLTILLIKKNLNFKIPKTRSLIILLTMKKIYLKTIKIINHSLQTQTFNNKIGFSKINNQMIDYMKKKTILKTTKIAGHNSILMVKMKNQKRKIRMNTMKRILKMKMMRKVSLTCFNKLTSTKIKVIQISFCIFEF